MKTLTSILAVVIIFLASSTSYAQPDSAKMSKKVLSYADSLVKTDAYENWPAYANLAPASVIKFYGGKDGYLDHVKTARMRTLSTTLENYPQLQVIHLTAANDQWQCLIRKSWYFHKEDKKYHQITYFLAQSDDEGASWKIFDLSFNKISNVIYIFPEVNGDMAIPEPSILSEQEELARQQAETAEAGKNQASKKK